MQGTAVISPNISVRVPITVTINSLLDTAVALIVLHVSIFLIILEIECREARDTFSKVFLETEIFTVVIVRNRMIIDTLVS